MLKDIKTKADYKEYQQRVEAFFEREGIANLTSDGESYFSWHDCECCHRDLGGNRYDCTGYNFTDRNIYEYSVCTDCLYYAEYGQLDDQTMLGIEEVDEDGVATRKG